MKKMTVSRRMHDVASEKSVTASSRARKLKKEHTSTRNPEKMTASSSKQINSSKFSQETSPSKLSVQACGEKLPEQASTSKFTEQSIASNLLEIANASKSPELIRTRKLAGTLSIYQLVERSTCLQSTIEREFTDKAFESEAAKFENEQIKKLKKLRKNNPKLKLLKHIDIGNMITICHQHPEFRALITSMFKVHEFVSSSWNRHEQDLLIKIFKNIEAVISEIVSMKSNPDSSDDIEDKFDSLSWYINEFIDILHVHMDNLHTEKLQFASFLSSSEGRKWLKEREKPEVDVYLTNELIKPKTYLSTRIDTECLIKIAQEHPELRPSVKCVLGVDSAMKYLEYGGQIKVFKVLAKVEKLLRQIVQQKHLGVSSLIETTTETLIDCINESFTEIMSNLSSQCEKLKKKDFECKSCPSVLKLVKDVNIKSQQQRLRRKDNPHSHLKGVVAVANYGISKDYLKNLETLFHHLAAKRGAYRHVGLYKTSVNWFEIAMQHEEYKSNSSENYDQMEAIRSHIIRRLDEYEVFRVEAREFAERIRRTFFPNTENLAEGFGLSCQLEYLVSEAEDYLTTLDRLIGHILSDLNRYGILNRSIRRDRRSFLLKRQTFAFDFPL